MAQTIIVIGFIQIYFQLHQQETDKNGKTNLLHLPIYRSSENKTYLYKHITITKIRLIISTTT